MQQQERQVLQVRQVHQLLLVRLDQVVHQVSQVVSYIT
jgi:hypothetical protein